MYSSQSPADWERSQRPSWTSRATNYDDMDSFGYYGPSGISKTTNSAAPRSTTHWSGLTMDRQHQPPQVSVDPNLPYEARRQLIRDLRLAAMRAAVMPQHSTTQSSEELPQTARPPRWAAQQAQSPTQDRQFQPRHQGYSDSPYAPSSSYNIPRSTNSRESYGWNKQNSDYASPMSWPQNSYGATSNSGLSQLDRFERDQRTTPTHFVDLDIPVSGNSSVPTSSQWQRTFGSRGPLQVSVPPPPSTFRRYASGTTTTSSSSSAASTVSPSRASDFVLMSPQQLMHQRSQRSLPQRASSSHSQPSQATAASGFIEVHHHHHHHYYDNADLTGIASPLQHTQNGEERFTKEPKPLSRTSPIQVSTYRKPAENPSPMNYEEPRHQHLDKNDQPLHNSFVPEDFEESKTNHQAGATSGSASRRSPKAATGTRRTVRKANTKHGEHGEEDPTPNSTSTRNPASSKLTKKKSAATTEVMNGTGSSKSRKSRTTTGGVQGKRPVASRRAAAQNASTRARARSRTASVVIAEVNRERDRRGSTATIASKSHGQGGYVHLAEAMAARDADVEQESSEEDEEEELARVADSVKASTKSAVSTSTSSKKSKAASASAEQQLPQEDEEPSPEQPPIATSAATKAKKPKKKKKSRRASQIEREAKLRDMLEQAKQLEKEVYVEDPRLALVPFGDRLKEAQTLKVKQSSSSSSKLPRFSSTRDLNPSRPPAEIPEPKVTVDTSDPDALRSEEDETALTGGPKNAEGWLLKMSRKSRWLSKSPPKWKKRFFRLSPQVLYCFKDSSSLTPKQMFSLDRIEIETDVQKLGTTPTPFAMFVYETGRQKDGFKVCSNNFKEILQWYRVIVHNAVLRENKHTMTPPKDPTPVDPEVERKKAEERELLKKLKEVPLPKSEDFYPKYIMPATHYDILGVEPDADRKVIRKQFYKLAASYHPDKNPDVDPSEFAMLSQAYTVLYDEQLRAKYDLGERIREVLRRGFDCVMFTPTKYIYKDEHKVPAELASRRVTLFTDGPLNHIFYQGATSDEFIPLQPEMEHSIESRFVEYVLYGRNDRVMRQTFLNPVVKERKEQELKEDATDEEIAEFEMEVLREIDTYVVLMGKKLSHTCYLQLDSAEACRDLIDGLRIVRCENSVLFAQRLEKLQTEKGFD
mmetsp:Transcript_461/g.737  ORF Transcript_461/g.737 Transcript_461/m.737 type:complete len:1153 (+) Transcript_461:163-3621(+)